MAVFYIGQRGDEWCVWAWARTPMNAEVVGVGLTREAALDAAFSDRALVVEHCQEKVYERDDVVIDAARAGIAPAARFRGVAERATSPGDRAEDERAGRAPSVG